MGAGQPKENLEMEDSLLSPSRLPLISWFDRFSIDREPEKKQTKAKGRGAEGLTSVLKQHGFCIFMQKRL